MTVEAALLMDELHIDQSDVETATIQALIDDAKEIVANSVSSTMRVANMESKYSSLFDRAVKTLATQMYYDRELANGTSKGFQMTIDHLTTKVLLDGLKDGDSIET